MIKTVGYNRFGFDSEVDVDLLRSLYLVSILLEKASTGADGTQAPAYVKEGSKIAPVAGSTVKGHGSESVYDKDSNTIQYTTVAKFPPVRLLPNADRKRILGECLL